MHVYIIKHVLEGKLDTEYQDQPQSLLSLSLSFPICKVGIILILSTLWTDGPRWESTTPISDAIECSVLQALERFQDERVWEEPLKGRRRPFKDTGPHSLLKWNGKVYILTSALHIASSLSYRELPVTNFLPDNLLMVNSTGLRTHTQHHWVHYHTKPTDVVSVGRLTRALLLQTLTLVCETDLFVIWWTWPVKISGSRKRTLEVVVVFRAGRWEKGVERKLAWVLG